MVRPASQPVKGLPGKGPAFCSPVRHVRSRRLGSNTYLPAKVMDVASQKHIYAKCFCPWRLCLTQVKITQAICQRSEIRTLKYFLSLTLRKIIIDVDMPFSILHAEFYWSIVRLILIKNSAHSHFRVNILQKKKCENVY